MNGRGEVEYMRTINSEEESAMRPEMTVQKDGNETQKKQNSLRHLRDLGPDYVRRAGPVAGRDR